MMDPESRRCWSWFILQLTKIQDLVMCLPWFLVASGLTPALTSRGFVEDDFAKVVDFFDMAVKLALKIKAEIKVCFISYFQVLLFESTTDKFRLKKSHTPNTRYLKIFGDNYQSI